jgi:hypothetical protein
MNISTVPIRQMPRQLHPGQRRKLRTHTPIPLAKSIPPNLRLRLQTTQPIRLNSRNLVLRQPLRPSIAQPLVLSPPPIPSTSDNLVFHPLFRTLHPLVPHRLDLTLTNPPRKLPRRARRDRDSVRLALDRSAEPGALAPDAPLLAAKLKVFCADSTAGRSEFGGVEEAFAGHDWACERSLC